MDTPDIVVEIKACLVEENDRPGVLDQPDLVTWLDTEGLVDWARPSWTRPCLFEPVEEDVELEVG